MKKIFYLYSKSLLSKLALIAILIVGVGSHAWGDTIIVNGGTVDSNWTSTFQSNTSDISTWSNASLTSNSEITLVAGQKIVINARGKSSSTSGNRSITVSYYKDENWIVAKEISKTEINISTGQYLDYTIDNIVGSYIIKIDGVSISITSIIIKDATRELTFTPNEPASFGDVTADANKVYTITNHTGATVNITPSIEGSDMFSVSPNVETEIADGESQDFTISFDWQADVAKLGEKTATVTFTPDTEDEPFVISASATAKTQAVFDEYVTPSYTSGNKSLLIKYTPSSGWNTFCMPIVISPSNFQSYMTAIFGSGCKAYQLDSYSDNTLKFNKVTQLSSATPYLVYVPTAASHEDGVLFESMYIYSTPAGSVTQGDATFQGTYAPITAGNFTSSMYGVTSAGQVRPGDGVNANMKGYRAYFTGISAPSTPGARITLVFEDDGETTDLGFVKMVDPEATDVYTLSGQKVKKGSKGIYIVNGRKVVIK